MSIYEVVNKLADHLALQCQGKQAFLFTGTFSSLTSYKKKKKILRQRVWQKLLEKKAQRDKCCRSDGNVIDENDEKLSSTSLLFEALSHATITRYQFHNSVEVLDKIDIQSDSLSSVVKFLLCLQNTVEEKVIKVY